MSVDEREANGVRDDREEEGVRMLAAGPKKEDHQLVVFELCG